MGKDLKGKELGKGILQRKDGRYCGRFTDRFGQRQCLYSFKLSELRTMMTEAMYENDKRLNVYNERITVDDWYEKWVELYKRNIVRDTTLKNYQSNYRAHIKKKIGFIRLRDLNMAHIQKLLNGMRDAGYHYKTILQIRIILVDMFEKAILSEFMTKNPAKNVTIVKDGKQERRVLTQAEESEFLKAASGNWYEMLFQLALLTGLRQGELCALTWDDVDWDAGLLHVTKTLIYSKLEGDTAISFKVNPPKTRNSHRDIPLTNEALRILKKQNGQDERLMAQTGKRGNLKPVKGFENLIFKTRTAAPISGQTFGDAIKTVIRTTIRTAPRERRSLNTLPPHTLRHSSVKPRTKAYYPLRRINIQINFIMGNFCPSSIIERITSQYKKSLKKRLKEGMIDLTPNRRTTMKHILLLEDDAALGQGIRFALENDGIRVDLYTTLSQAQSILPGTDFDLLILDVNLPDGSGLDLLQDVRRCHSSVPVILLTANDLETDIVLGLESGADDYITKPFSLAVLRARVNAQLRRGAPLQTATVELESFSFDFEWMEFRKNGQLIELSKTEQRLLRTLVENRGRVLSREALLERVWSGGAEYVEENALSVTVKRLRDKLEDTPSKPRFLKTVYGIGYTWAVN